MLSKTVVGLAVCAGLAFAQPAKIDFGRDVLPIFKQNCIGCHGPSVANSGLRLDRKSSVFNGGSRRVVPGSSQNSFLYHRLVSSEYGLQMPPTGALKPEQIAIIKAWIEQGAEWPDSLSNEADRPPLNPKAVAAIEMLRSGDRQGFLGALAADPQLANARGPEGSTPFMYAALYGDAVMLEQLLKEGANPNLKNDAGATALMWAATNLEKTRLLVAHGADVNAISDDIRTPLMIAASVPNGRPIVKFLLDHQANVNPTHHPDSESSPLAQSAEAADPEMMRMLIDRGADVKASAASALIMSAVQGCDKCVDLILKHELDKMTYTIVLGQVASFAGVKLTRTLLDRGAAIDVPDPLGHTALAYAAGADNVRAEVVKLLVERGANINSTSPHANSGDTGMSVLDLARLRGDTAVTAVLVKAGAHSVVSPPAIPVPQPANSIPAAIERALPLLQRADAGFTAKSGCISCHNESFTAMAIGLARDRGFTVDERLSAAQVRVNVAYLRHERGALDQGFMLGVPDYIGPFVFGYVLAGLHAEHYKADLNTDAVAMYIKSHQLPDGHWGYPAADPRPPICSDYVGNTAIALRALDLYAPAGQKAEYDKAVAAASAWIARAEARTTEDSLWRLQGLAWAGRDREAIAKAQREVLALQRSDGGWGDLPSMQANAYATGRALVALNSAGMAPAELTYQRGIEYLLKTQLADGSWFVRTRALALQPFFESGFPHGVNQSISAAATGWATMALILSSSAAPGPASRAAER